MKFDFALILACALFLLSFAGPVRATTINFYGHGDKNSGSWNDGPNDPNKDYSDFWSNDGNGDPDGHYTKYSPPPPAYSASNFGDGWTHDKKWDPDDKNDYRRYYASICDKKTSEGEWGRPHDPSCDPDPAPLPGALPMFGTGLLVLFGFGVIRRLRLSRRRLAS